MADGATLAANKPVGEVRSMTSAAQVAFDDLEHAVTMLLSDLQPIVHELEPGAEKEITSLKDSVQTTGTHLGSELSALTQRITTLKSVVQAVHNKLGL